jgi:hypothetical protein
MNSITSEIAVFGKPYTLTRSRLGAVTKVFGDKYVCDISSLKELFTSISSKIMELQIIGSPTFSFLISFADKTHHDGLAEELTQLQSIPIGKQTDRIVLRWVAKNRIDDLDNEISITVRISNPINPLLFLQAALSKSPSDIDNLEFEQGATCVTVDGSGQLYAEEVFLRVKNWIDARDKAHAFTSLPEIYIKHESLIDHFTAEIFPFLATLGILLFSFLSADMKHALEYATVTILFYFLLRSWGSALCQKMAQWARRTQYISLFQLTNGDRDSVTKLAAKSKNSFIKLSASLILSFFLNVAAGVSCGWLLAVKI